MTNYADMTELERCWMLAELCGFFQCGVFNDVIQIKRHHDSLWEDWNPFKDANALEEVEAEALKRQGGYKIQVAEKSVRYVFWTHPKILQGEGPTKADAIAQVVWMLGERKG